MPPGNRPKECHTKHLTEMERFRVRTLYFDAGMSKKRIAEVTKYSISQIRTAIRAESAAVPPRSGRPKKSLGGQTAPGPSANNGGPSSDGATPGGVTPVPNSHPSVDPVLASRASSAQSPESAEEEHQHVSGSHPSFNSLPPEIRWYIWELVLTTPPPSSSSPSPSLASSQTSQATPPFPISCTWWLKPLPTPPFAQAGVMLEHWAAQWRTYTHHRLPAAKLLSAVNREARRVVLAVLAPVWSEAGARMLGAAVPFLWMDPRRDVVYCKGAVAEDLLVVLARARAAVLPHLGAVAGAVPVAGGSNGSGGGGSGGLSNNTAENSANSRSIQGEA